MRDILQKLNYRNQGRIAILNAEKKFLRMIRSGRPELKIDTEIDPRFPYEFMIIFVRFLAEVDEIAPKAIHNLVSDGVLWFAYPNRKSSARIASDLDNAHGWEILLERGFDRVRQVIIDENWSAIRFRNIRYIKSPKYQLHS
ncbi:MAG TPA: hypothetical protein P5320_10875 [Bacteroidales bacterium]|nr:hypothetical protein [Bacteroidales bacterium]HOK73633.1 hypothetical protein [Bacteroidales bacterium]HOM39371.1 hypothetical protein [Bacteroidales bacterium]HOU31284.1 hypothetical protein [Bacteroidales bacterium]HPP91480.1 hypothetical protein [Bacteroidales bacterium]